MKYDHIKTSINDGIETIVINRPKALNALNTQVLHELDNAIGNIDEKRIRCVVITGSGERAFVAGADILEMKDFGKEEAYEFSKYGNKVFSGIQKLTMPTIAVINGYALGGGCELALSCDIRICSTESVFGQPETGLGIIPGFGGTQRLSRLVGTSFAKQMIFTAKSISAEEAYRIGLVNYLCKPEELISIVEEVSYQIIRNAPIAVAAAKRAIDQGVDLELPAGLELEERLFSSVFETQDQIEGMAAFLEKRKHISYQNR